MGTEGAQKRARPWGDRLYQLLLDEYMDTVPGARRHGFQAWLVAESGVKRATIGTWWASRKRPDIGSLAKLRQALPGLTVTQMVAAIEGVELELRSHPADAEWLVDLPADVRPRADDALEQAVADVVVQAGVLEGARRDRNRAREASPAPAPSPARRSRARSE